LRRNESGDAAAVDDEASTRGNIVDEESVGDGQEHPSSDKNTNTSEDGTVSEVQEQAEAEPSSTLSPPSRQNLSDAPASPDRIFFIAFVYSP
jgi:hypothetical protein